MGVQSSRASQVYEQKAQPADGQGMLACRTPGQAHPGSQAQRNSPVAAFPRALPGTAALQTALLPVISPPSSPGKTFPGAQQPRAEKLLAIRSRSRPLWGSACASRRWLPHA